MVLFGCTFSPKNDIKVGVIGNPSTGLVNYLQSADARYASIYYSGILSSEGIIPEGSLNKYDIVVLQNIPTCDRYAQKTISDWVKAGGKLIVVGDACSRMDVAGPIGWEKGFLGDVIPAKLRAASDGGIKEYTCSSGTYRPVEVGHPIMAGLGDFHFRGGMIDVAPISETKLVAAIDCPDGGADSLPSYYAILQRLELTKGKSIYFSYDPGISSPTLLGNLFDYLAK
ncbi:MAG: hypothetical protein ABIG96_04570 [Candidatus Micrarchaeota archaeon]